MIINSDELASSNVKNYVLDTNVLLHDSSALGAFDNNHVYLPTVVIQELDRFKKGGEEMNVNARAVTRRLEALTKDGVKPEGIELGSGRLFFLDTPPYKTGKLTLLDRIFTIAQNKLGYADDEIIELARNLSQKSTNPTIIVSKDLNLRIKSRRAGIQADDYLHDKVAGDVKEILKSESVVDVEGTVIDQVFKHPRGFRVPLELESILSSNTYFTLRNSLNHSQSAQVRYALNTLFPVKGYDRMKGVEDIKPRNTQQGYLLDACLDEDINVVAAVGMAGTGKTLLSVAAGMTQVMKGDLKRYDKVVVVRPIREVGASLGFLPGEKEDKIAPYYAPIKTAMSVIFGENASSYGGFDDLIEFRPITYLRGDTLHRSFVIVDEAQNLTPKEIKTIGTRIGDDSKLVLCGDPFQIDNPMLDERSNGLIKTIYALRGNITEFAYVTLEKVERGRIAEIFAKHM